MSKKGRIIGVSVTSCLIALTLLFIFINSCLPRDTSAQTSGRLFTLLQGAFDAIFGQGVITHNFLRKFMHFSEFMALGFEICALYFFIGNFNFFKFLHIAPYGLFVAVIDESIQILSNRGAQVQDVLLDYVGYLTAVAVTLITYSIIYAVKRKKIK